MRKVGRQQTGGVYRPRVIVKFHGRSARRRHLRQSGRDSAPDRRGRSPGVVWRRQRHRERPDARPRGRGRTGNNSFIRGHYCFVGLIGGAQPPFFVPLPFMAAGAPDQARRFSSRSSRVSPDTRSSCWSCHASTPSCCGLGWSNRRPQERKSTLHTSCSTRPASRGPGQRSFQPKREYPCACLSQSRKGSANGPIRSMRASCSRTPKSVASPGA